MHEPRLNFERQINALAAELGYKLSLMEIQLYVAKLEKFGLRAFAHACLAFRESDYLQGTFPSINEFENQIQKIGYA